MVKNIEQLNSEPLVKHILHVQSYAEVKVTKAELDIILYQNKWYYIQYIQEQGRICVGGISVDVLNLMGNIHGIHELCPRITFLGTDNYVHFEFHVYA